MKNNMHEDIVQIIKFKRCISILYASSNSGPKAILEIWQITQRNKWLHLNYLCTNLKINMCLPIFLCIILISKNILITKKILCTIRFQEEPNHTELRACNICMCASI